MQNKLIVFDWNGTILSDTILSWKAGNVCLEYYGHPRISLKQYRETFTFPILHFYKLNGLSVDHVLKHKDEANKVYQEAYEQLSARSRTRKGTRPLLGWIKKNNMSCIILSNYRTDKINEHLRRLKIEHYFHHVDAHNCDGTTILESTTKIDRLSEFMTKRRFSPQDTVIIGDSMEEPEIGRALGLTSIGITDGYITPARLRHAGPDHIIHSLSEIKPILKDKWSL